MAKIIVNDGEGESEFALTDRGATIGRVAKQCDIVIKVPEASREHCRVKLENGAWFVEDLGSSNGTRVNGRKVTTFELQDGDEIVVGQARLRFLESDLSEPEISLEDDDEDLDLEISLEEEAYLRFLNTDKKGEKVVFAGRMTFGRRSSNSVALNEKGVSGNHSEFNSDAGDWIARDLGSTNGTLVNGEPAVETRLEPGDRVRIGTVEFVFGVGDNEGDTALADTVTMEEVPLEEEIFAISEANMKRKQKAATVFWLAFIVAVAGAGAWWLMQGSSSTKTRKKPPVFTNSILGSDGNFEPREDEEDYLTTDSDAVDYIETTKRKASGERALEVKVNDADGDHYLAFTKEVQNISTADRVTIGAKIRTSGVSGGAAGLSLLWKDANGRVIDASHLNGMKGESDFQEISGTFLPPFGTESAAVAIGFHDAQGKVVVDDVFAQRTREGHTMVAHGHDLLLDQSAGLTVSRDGAEILDRGGLYQIDGKDPKLLSRLFSATESQKTETSASVKGEISLDDGRVHSTSIKAEGSGFLWQGTIDNPSSLKVGFRVDVLDGVVTVSNDGARRHAEEFVRESVSELVIASGPRALRFSFAEPVTVSMINSKRGGIILLPANGSFSFPVQLNFDAELDQVNALRDKATRADLTERKYGEAIGFYREIVNRYSFRKDAAARATNRIAELSRKAETALTRLNKEVDDVIFFQTFEDNRERLNTDLTEMLTAYATSEFEPRFKATKDRLDSSWGEVSSKRRMALAENHLLRGRDLMQPGSSAPVLARGFFLSVVRLAPDGELAEAAQAELNKIKSLLGSN